VYLPVALVLLVIGAITALPVVVGLAVRRTAFRADYVGITLGADLRDGWTLRWDRAVFVPWPDVEQIVIYPGPGFPAGSRARRIGIQRRQDTPGTQRGRPARSRLPVAPGDHVGDPAGRRLAAGSRPLGRGHRYGRAGRSSRRPHPNRYQPRPGVYLRSS